MDIIVHHMKQPAFSEGPNGPEAVFRNGKRVHTLTGITVAVGHDGDDRFVAVSRCSRLDQFSRKVGHACARGRCQVLHDTYRELAPRRKALMEHGTVVLQHKPGQTVFLFWDEKDYNGDTVKVRFMVPQWMLEKIQPKKERPK